MKIPPRSKLPALAGFLLSVLLLLSSVSAEVWPVKRAWTDEEEQAYSRWFERLAAHSWHSINAMLRSKEYNSLYDAKDDSISFYADCADFPYMVRAYYAYKRGLPFIGNFVAGGRYSTSGNETESTIDNLSFDKGLKKFFSELTLVHSGNYRTKPDATNSFTYPLAITRKALRPGMIFYSPDGHVALVAECRADGTILLADAHPDQSVTRIVFGPKLEVRSRTDSGGFRGFRKVVVQRNQAVWVKTNANLPGFSKEQYELKDDYFETVRARMNNLAVDPMKAFEAYIREDTYQEALDRKESVERGWEAGKAKEIAIPPNIYESEGDWEDFSSPSRDLRLRLSMLHVPELIRQYVKAAKEHPETFGKDVAKDPAEMGKALLKLKERLFEELKIEYVNSRGEKVPLSLAQIEKRLFRLSFDPNHAPELRWGASGDELATADTSSPRFMAKYEEEQPWRNRMEKKNSPMKIEDADNPSTAPEHDLTKLALQSIEAEVGATPTSEIAQPAASTESTRPESEPAAAPISTGR